MCIFIKDMENNTKNSGIGLGGILFIVFSVLKLTGHISWSWWLVTSPLWIWPSMVIFGLFLIILSGVIVGLLTNKKSYEKG